MPPKRPPAFASSIDTNSPEFKANRAAMQSLVDELEERVATVRRHGGERYTERHKSRGRLLARERINRLLDDQSPFLEIGQLAAWDMYSGDLSSAGVIAGIGRVEGVECVIVANDATVKGGT